MNFSFSFLFDLGSTYFIFFSVIIVFFILFSVGMIISGIRNIALAPKKINEMKLKKQEFLNKVSQEKSLNLKKLNTSKWIYCPHCGDKIEPEEQICDKCGNEL